MPTDDVRQLPVRMPADLYDALKGAAYFQDTSMNQLAVSAISRYLQDETVSGKTVRAIVDRARDEYAVALDKLKDM